MESKAVLGLVLMLLLTCTLTFAVNVQSVKTSETATAQTQQKVGTLSEAGPPIQWNKTYGGANDDDACSVIQTSDGGYALAGYTNSFGAGDYDFWLVRADENGNLLWNKTYGSTSVSNQPDDNRLPSAIQTSDGGYIMVGTAEFTFILRFVLFWAVKTDYAGNVQWEKYYGLGQANIPLSVIQTADKGYVIAGITVRATLSGWNIDAWLVKTDGNGNALWNKTYGGTGEDQVYSLVQTSDGGYALAGYTNSFGAGGFDAWLIKTDSSGNVQWNQTYGGAQDDKALSLVRTYDGGYVLAGDTQSSGAGKDDFWLIKTDESGNKLWEKTYGGTAEDFAQSVVQTADGGFVLAGNTNSSGNFDLWLVRTDVSGNMLWNISCGGVGPEGAHSIIQTWDGGFAVAGFTNSFGAGNADVWLVKIGAEPNLIDSDGDGLYDNWEKYGIDYNGDGVIDFTLPGADPKHKNLYVEIDYMGSDGTHNHKPDPNALQDVINAFANAPVNNPDGTNGIKLQIEVDESIPHQNVINVWDDFNNIKNNHFGTPGQRANPNSLNILAAKRMAYRYCLFIHEYALWNGTAWVTTTSSGIAELPGNDFIVSLGNFTNHRGTRDEQAATFMHELGHTLGLRHGGGDDINGKPNYLSIMSYTRQFSWWIPNRPLDYSRSQLPDLDERNLDERVGIQGPAGDQTLYGIINPTTGDWMPAWGPSQGPIDWNLDGDTNDVGVAISINIFFPGTEFGFGDNDLTVLKGYNDWANIQLNFRFSKESSDGVHANVADKEITWEIVQQMKNATTYYYVAINAHCNTEGVDISVPITMDGSPTGYNTPHTFTGLTGTHTFTLPNTDPSGHPFKQWSTGSTSTTITVSAGGTYTAYYQAPTPGVGGIVIPVDKLALLAPYIGLTSTVTVAAVATVVYVKRVKRRKE